MMQIYDYKQTRKPVEFVEKVEPTQQSKKFELTKKSNWKDVIIVIIPAQGEKEYKLQVDKGASFEYSWETDKGVLFFDLHGEPTGDTTGYFKTFEKNINKKANGSLTTVFKGTHGWYWKNYNTFPVSITLNVRGEYQRFD